MIHVVFQQADVAVLQKALELDQTLTGDVIEIKDDFAVGPLQDIYEREGYQSRSNWWRSLLDFSPYHTEEAMQLVDDRLAVHNLKKALDSNESEVAWIWMGQNQHDVCGYYWLMTQLKEYSERILILYLNNLPFINEKGGIFYPPALHQIQPKEFLKAKKLARLVSKSEWELDPDEWARLCSDNATIRTLDGGKKIVSQADDFYDMDILKSLSADWQKGNRAMQNILVKMKIKTGDVFLLWRMKHLADAGKIEINGEPARGWKEFDVRLKQTEPEAVL